MHYASSFYLNNQWMCHFMMRFFIMSNLNGIQPGNLASSTAITIIVEKPTSINCLNVSQLEMWANAQRDGRPAEHRWRPLFDAAKFG